ncbi:hypothetical protein GCM10020331_012760 [Ectobacillus funiculus]
MAWVSEEDITVTVPTEAPLQPTDERYNDMIERLIRLEEHNKRQESFNQELLHQLQKNNNNTSKKVWNEEIKTLMETVREIQETKLFNSSHTTKKDGGNFGNNTFHTVRRENRMKSLIEKNKTE